MKRQFMLLVGMSLMFSAWAGAEQRLGRLFFTPDQRARMDVARQHERSIRIEAEQQDNEPPAANITLNGMITRSDGKTTVWINNKEQSGDKAGSFIAVPGRGKPAGQVSITSPDTKRTVPLKVGQSIDMSSGQVEEVYRRPPPAAPEPEKDMPPTAGKTDTAKPSLPRKHKEEMPADDQGEAATQR